tara:strand:+ start:262 stop:522 length:261 start_codon:yes stop_codon:yes gene_type:complete
MAIKKEEKKAIDNITYKIDKDKKIENTMVAKLTKQQKTVLKKKQNLANMMGESIKIEDVVNDPIFKTIGDKKKPATKEEIKEFLEE